VFEFFRNWRETGSISEAFYYKQTGTRRVQSYGVWSHPAGDTKPKHRGIFGIFGSGTNDEGLNEIIKDAYDARIRNQDFRQNQGQANYQLGNPSPPVTGGFFGPTPTGYQDMNGMWHDN
jgi:hypothetical protein